jgi:hypothetical protein
MVVGAGLDLLRKKIQVLPSVALKASVSGGERQGVVQWRLTRGW